MSDILSIRSASKTYDVRFVADFVPSLEKELASSGVLIIDARVFEAYRNRIEGALKGKEYILVTANEEAKTIDKSKELIEELVARGVRRNQTLIAIGGGVVQDIVGFTASILYRGVEWVFFPTTLLAQADSCIGSKTSINLGGRKNLVGTFYPPTHIYLDPGFTETLSVEEVKSGIGEMMHFYIYQGSPFFEKLIKNYNALITDRALLMDYIQESLSIKKSVVEIDEFDRGERNKFNYGHTFGHALESVTGYQVNHGQAVTVGMDIANFLSSKMGLMQEEVFKDLHGKLCINFPTESLKNLDLSRYLEALSKDKKNVGATIGCILAEEPGKLVKQQIPADEHFTKLLTEYFVEVYA